MVRLLTPISRPLSLLASWALSRAPERFWLHLHSSRRPVAEHSNAGKEFFFSRTADLLRAEYLCPESFTNRNCRASTIGYSWICNWAPAEPSNFLRSEFLFLAKYLLASPILLLDDQITHFHQETSFNLTLNGFLTRAPEICWLIFWNSRIPSNWALQCRE